MQQIRVDIYGGYKGEDTPDPDHKYSWSQYDYETAQDFLERIIEYVSNMVEQLDQDNEDE